MGRELRRVGEMVHMSSTRLKERNKLTAQKKTRLPGGVLEKNSRAGGVAPKNERIGKEKGCTDEIVMKKRSAAF